MSALLTLAFLEAAIRVLGIEPSGPRRLTAPTGMHLEDAELGHRLAPNVSIDLVRPDFQTEVTTNSLGMRSPEVGPKASGTTRILSMGDSYAFGYGVAGDETYAWQLEQLLGPGFEVLNAGVSGYSTIQATDLLRRLTPEVEPDLVLLGFFTGNDFHENLERAGRYRRSYDAGIAGWLVANSRLVALVVPLLKNLEVKLRMQQGIDLSVQAVEELKEVCARAGAPLVILLITPPPGQLDLYKERSRLRLALDRAIGFDPAGGRAQLAARTRAMGIPVLDMSEVFESVESQDDLGLPVSGHWTPRGHRIAAQALLDLLRAENLI
jgi:lysophospholipase L1-like esterase